jgi:putative selenium metabolism hydrolase
VYKKILKLSEQYSSFTCQTLSEMIRIKSFSTKESEIIDYLRNKLNELKFDEVRVDGLGSLVARIGNGSKVLAVDAHIDTVESGDAAQWDRDPFSGYMDGQYVYGRGTVDQKGGAASMITAGRILKELDYTGIYSIYFTFTVMEEDCDGLCWNYLIEEEGLAPDFALITEPTGLDIFIGQRGRLEIEADIKGVSSHGSMPEKGINAVSRASGIVLEVDKLNKRLPSDKFLGKGTITTTMIESGSPSLCAVPDICRLHFDRRLTAGESRESALKEINNITGTEDTISVPVYNTPSYKNTIFEQEKYFPGWKLDNGHALLKAGKVTFKNLFSTDADIGKWIFSTNGVSLAGKHNIPCIGFGPGDETLAHAPNERVPVEDLKRASAFYALLPYTLENNEGSTG